MKNTFTLILACGLASVLQAHIIGYRRQEEMKNNDLGGSYQKRRVPASTCLWPCNVYLIQVSNPYTFQPQPSPAQGFQVPVVLIYYPVRYIIFPQDQTNTFHGTLADIVDVKIFNAVDNQIPPESGDAADMDISARGFPDYVDAPKVTDTVVQKTEPPPPLVEEQSDDGENEATLTLDYLTDG